MRIVFAALLVAWIGIAHAQAPASQRDVNTVPVATTVQALPNAAGGNADKFEAVAATRAFMDRLQSEARAKSDAYA